MADIFSSSSSSRISLAPQDSTFFLLCDHIVSNPPPPHDQPGLLLGSSTSDEAGAGEVSEDNDNQEGDQEDQENQETCQGNEENNENNETQPELAARERNKHAALSDDDDDQPLATSTPPEPTHPPPPPPLLPQIELRFCPVCYQTHTKDTTTVRFYHHVERRLEGLRLEYGLQLLAEMCGERLETPMRGDIYQLEDENDRAGKVRNMRRVERQAMEEVVKQLQWGDE